MANEITVNTLGDAVRDRVRKALFESIPDSAIEQLIASELEKMTKVEYQYRSSGGNREASALSMLIETEIKKQLGERATVAVTKYLDETYKNQTKEMVDAAIKELAPLFIAGMVENFASAAVNGLRQQLAGKGIYV